jgi:hypothetical protein
MPDYTALVAKWENQTGTTERPARSTFSHHRLHSDPPTGLNQRGRRTTTPDFCNTIRRYRPFV